MLPPKDAEVSNWLEKSMEDLQAAEWLLKSPNPLHSAVCFHCQQVVEKALKGYLTWKEEEFEKTHSLVALVGKCLKFDSSFSELRLAATTLTPFAVDYRYPGVLPELTLQESREALQSARLVWEFMVERIPKHLFPTNS
jgi:HEPN domain-containing protein